MSITSYVGRWVGVALAAAAVLGAGCDDEEGVRLAFEQYQAAIRGGDVETVIRCTDPKNFEQYDRLAEAARTAGPDEIRQMRVLDRMHILQMRNRLAPAELKTLDGRGWLRLAAERRWSNAESQDRDITLGAVRFRKPRAFAELVVNGRASGVELEFVRIGDEWIMDLEPMHQVMSDALARALRGMGMPEEVAMRRIEEAATGKKIGKAIWNPPRF